MKINSINPVNQNSKKQTSFKGSAKLYEDILSDKLRSMPVTKDFDLASLKKLKSLTDSDILSIIKNKTGGFSIWLLNGGGKILINDKTLSIEQFIRSQNILPRNFSFWEINKLNSHKSVHPEIESVKVHLKGIVDSLAQFMDF